MRGEHTCSAIFWGVGEGAGGLFFVGGCVKLGYWLWVLCGLRWQIEEENCLRRSCMCSEDA